MARKKKAPEFPVRLTHPDIKGSEVHAATASSLKVYEAHGWKRDTSADDSGGSTATTTSES